MHAASASLRLVVLSLALTGSTSASSTTSSPPGAFATAEAPPKAPDPKPDAPKPEAPKPDAPKPDAPKPHDPKSPPPKPPAAPPAPQPKDPKSPPELPPLEKPKGIPDGEMKPFADYWEDGKSVKYKYEMRKDPADGKWKRNGYSQAFFANGVMEREGYYKNNERVGRWRYFNIDGTFNRIEERGDGKPPEPKPQTPAPKPPEPKPEAPKPQDPKPGAPK